MSSETLAQPISLRADTAAMRRGDISPRQLVASKRARFNAVDAEIQAYLPEADRFARLQSEAKALQNRYPDPRTRPPLYGALLAVKDIFHVNGFVTRAGSDLPPELFAGEQASVVTRLLDAGALIAGKAATTESAYFEPGPTRNPRNPAHTPGGSSSGSAAAVAAGLAHVALGTQTVGSVIRPAAYCGIVGFKPSFDRVATDGLARFSHSADHVGFFTSGVADMQAVAALTVDSWDPAADTPVKPILGAPDGPYLRQATALDAFESQLVKLARAGYTVEWIDTFDDIVEIAALHQDMIAAELAEEHRSMFAEYSQLYRPRTAELIRQGQTVSQERLHAARLNRLVTRGRLQNVMRQHGIDLWISPAAPDVAPRGIGNTGDPKMNLPWTHAGLPAISLPAGKGAHDLPLGLQLVGRYGEDETLLNHARGIEAIFR